MHITTYLLSTIRCLDHNNTFVTFLPFTKFFCKCVLQALNFSQKKKYEENQIKQYKILI